MSSPSFQWNRTESELREFLTASLQRALLGVAPQALRALSFNWDPTSKHIRLRAHFERPHTEDEFDTMASIEGETNADFPDEFVVSTEFEVVPAGAPIQPLSGGVVYLRETELVPEQASGSSTAQQA